MLQLYWSAESNQLSEQRKLCELQAEAPDHTSICDRNSQLSSEGAAMPAAQAGENVRHPVVVVKVNGVKCRALLDTGATGTYISALLVDLLKVKPARTLTRGIDDHGPGYQAH